MLLYYDIYEGQFRFTFEANNEIVRFVTWGIHINFSNSNLKEVHAFHCTYIFTAV